MRWCCAALQYHFEHRKERGIAVVAVPPNELHKEPGFQLSLRSVDEAAIRSFLSPLTDQHVAHTLQTWVYVRYCPWCGIKLARFYKKTWPALHDESELALYAARTKTPAQRDGDT
jgi:hypothetical protein